MEQKALTLSYGAPIADTRYLFDYDVTNNSGLGSVNYGLNSKNYPAKSSVVSEPPLKIDTATVDKQGYRSQADDYSQAGAFFRLMNQQQKEQLTGNIAGSFSRASVEMQDRMLVYFDRCDQEYGRVVKKSIDELIKLEKTS